MAEGENLNILVNRLRLRCLNLDLTNYFDRLLITDIIKIILELLPTNNIVSELLSIIYLVSLNTEENLGLIRRFYLILTDSTNFLV